MPSKNIIKEYSEDSFYHVYNRGINRQKIFNDKEDYSVFLNLLKRYLSDEKQLDSKGRVYDNYYEQLDLMSFCLMPNHFHLFLFQSDKTAMSRLIRAVCGSYTIYFNKKYKRLGPLFQSRFKASRIDSDECYMYISKYVHLNPKNYKTWEWSSLPYFRGDKVSSWVKPSLVLEMFKSVEEYMKFLEQDIDDEIQDRLGAIIADG